MNATQRINLAGKLRNMSATIAKQVTEEFLTRHPDWVERYGELARIRGVEDAEFHIQFLAGAVQTGDPRAYAEYARWARRVLEPRGIAASFLLENIRQISSALANMLEQDEWSFVEACVAAAADVCAPDVTPAPEPSDSGLSPATRVFVPALFGGNRKAAWNMVREHLQGGTEIPEIYTDILQDAMYEVGRLWEANIITVAQEHLATAIIQYIIAQLYPLLPQSGDRLGRMVITGVEGELHQVGANMVADIMEADGWDVRFLGTNVPELAAVEAVRDHRADLVGISATMHFNIPRVQSLINAVRSAGLSREPRFLIGGGAFRTGPDICAEIGADAFASNLREACQAGRKLRSSQTA